MRNKFLLFIRHLVSGFLLQQFRWTETVCFLGVALEGDSGGGREAKVHPKALPDATPVNLERKVHVGAALGLL